MIKNDKVAHAVAGLMVSAAGLFMQAVLNVVFDTVTSYAFTPLICGVVAGLAKEAADWLDNRQTNTAMHTVDPLDVLATAAPGAVMTGVILAMGGAA